MAHSLVGALSRLVATPWWAAGSRSRPGAGVSAGAACQSACATASAPNVC